MHIALRIVAALAVFFIASLASAQQRTLPPGTRPTTGPTTRPGGRGPNFISPEVLSDRRITFRLYAPLAENVRLSAGDIPGNPNRGLTRNEQGVWEFTAGPVPAGAYRYTFSVGGVAVIDPRNPATSESNGNVWSLAVVPGHDLMDIKDVPHGAVASVYYPSTSLGRTRRMHVYTPPGYENGGEKYPVFYLLHGAGDCDDSWTSVGRANFILDNLIAARKAKPMIVVMPAGHTNAPGAAARPGGPSDFENDFTKDIKPYIESHYRVLADRQNRAIAGLSMGGGQTLTLSLAHPEDFAYVGVFSSALFQRDLSAWEQQHSAELDSAAAKAKEGWKLFWFSTGTDDFLVARTRQTTELLKKHGFVPIYKEGTGGHTWLNWRDYLIEFAPQLFQ